MCLHKKLVKAIGIACAFFLFCITNVYAKDEVSAWVGNSTVELKADKGIYDISLENNIKSNSSTFIAPSLVLEYMHGICNDYKIGARLGALYKDINITFDLRKEGNLNIEDNNSYCRITVIPVMFGGSYTKKISRKFNLNGKAFLGCAFVDFKSKNSFTNKNSNEKIDKELNKTTGCFISDFSIGAEWLFTKRLTIGIDLGYRFTPEVAPSKDIKLDFSGFVWNLGVSYKI
jgi:hypothetical protein